MAAFGTLPVGRAEVRTRDPLGTDELLVLESVGAPHRTMRELADRLVTTTRGERLDWHELPAVELTAAALFIRNVWIGPTIRAEAHCPVPECGGDIDISFTADAYLDHHRPRRFRGVSQDGDWFALAGVRFRAPTLADVETSSSPDALASTCVDPPLENAATLRRVERALQAVAPTLDGMVSGICPLCETKVRLWFAPIPFVLDELRDVSAGLFEEVHELARAYHWSEEDILRLERQRRRGYVELVRAELAA